MNPSAIYSKTGKGVQEASGKTGILSRGDRAILSAIDGKISLKDLSARFDRAPDEKFFALIRKMDADGFIREVSPGTVQRGAANAPRATPSKPTPKQPKPAAGGAEDLDFTQIFSAPPKIERPSVAPPVSKDPMAAAREVAEARARAEREAKAKADAAAKAMIDSTNKMRIDAEARAKAAREQVMAAAAEGKTRAEIEARQRAEAEAQAQAQAQAEAAERARAQAERQAKERAEREAKERAEREVREKVQSAERARFEAAERARREAEELRFKIEEERRAREEAERRAREEAERTRREAGERARREAEEKKALAEAGALRQKYEEEKKAREEAERRADEERQKRERERQEEERKAREEYERQEVEQRAAREGKERKEAEEHQRQIRLAREAEDKKRRDADARRKKEEEAKRWEVEEARRKADDAYRQRAEQEDKARAEREVLEAAERAEAEQRAAEEADALAGSLLADLDTFSSRQDEERKLKEEQDRVERAEAERRAAEEQAQREREEADSKARRSEERRRREEEEQREREAGEQREREAAARKQDEEADKKRKERESLARNQEVGDIPISSADLDRGDIEDDERKLAPEARKALRDRSREVARARGRGDVSSKRAAAAYKRKQPTRWGKPVAIFLFLTLAIGAGVANFVPLDAAEYERVASEAVGAPVKIGAARMRVLTGVQLRFERVSVGDVAKIAEIRAVPELTSLLGNDKVFTRLEFEQAVVQQAALADVLFGTMKQGRLQVARVVAVGARFEGPLALPPMDVDASVGPSGKVFTVRLSGERIDGLVTPREQSVGFEVTMASFDVPFVDKLTLAEFGMKGSAERSGMSAEFDGRLYDGTVVGKARLEWGAQWSVQGEIQGRSMNAAVFAPQMVSQGRFDGKGRFAMSGAEPAQLGNTTRLDGEFTVTKGALGSFDLSRALQSSSAQASGRTPFTELEGRVSLAGGALAFRDLRLRSGLLGARGTLDVDAKGGLSGRVDAELRNLRGTYYIGGRLGDPQLRR